MSNCRDCKYLGFDLEDFYCTHPISHSKEEGSVFGRSINYARREGNFCGPTAKLFEQIGSMFV